MDRRSPKRWKLALLIACVVAAAAALAWSIPAALRHAQQASGDAQQQSTQATRAAATSCYETAKLLWYLDRASYAGYQRDNATGAFLHATATRAFNRGAAVIERLAGTFDSAAQDAYWQPIPDCAQVLQPGRHAGLQTAVPIDTVPPAVIRATLSYPPHPPR
jgi:hypothetical protein